jgi:hypothetical protein
LRKKSPGEFYPLKNAPPDYFLSRNSDYLIYSYAFQQEKCDEYPLRAESTKKRREPEWIPAFSMLSLRIA